MLLWSTTSSTLGHVSDMAKLRRLFQETFKKYTDLCLIIKKKKIIA